MPRRRYWLVAKRSLDRIVLPELAVLPRKFPGQHTDPADHPVSTASPTRTRLDGSYRRPSRRFEAIVMALRLTLLSGHQQVIALERAGPAGCILLYTFHRQ